MPRWEYCYVYASLAPTRDYFIARPDRAETRTDIRENQLLEILGGEGWELVSVVGVGTQYQEGPTHLEGIRVPGAQGSANASDVAYYFKRPMAEAATPPPPPPTMIS